MNAAGRSENQMEINEILDFKAEKQDDQYLSYIGATCFLN